MSAVSKRHKPGYKLHRPSGQARVIIQGHHHYLGEFGSQASWEKYDRLIAEHFSGPAATVGDPELTVIELSFAYWQWAQGYYLKDGEPTAHLNTVKQALTALKRLYASVPACKLTPLCVAAIQQHLIEQDRALTYINQLVSTIRRVYKWAVSKEMLPETVYRAIATVPGLKAGRCKARVTRPVEAVDDATVDATLPHLPATIADMVRLQRLAGCRPTEICIMRPCDVDRSGDVWVYSPSRHKTEHHGRRRQVFIGPKAQAVLAPYLLRDAESFCFSPIDSERHRRSVQRIARKSNVQPSQLDRRRARPKRKPRDKYTKDSYGRAVRRGCVLANAAAVKTAGNVPHCVQLFPFWHPNRLRHSAATQVRRQFGIEAVQVVLGHAHAQVSEIYAERDAAKAAEVMKNIG